MLKLRGDDNKKIEESKNEVEVKKEEKLELHGFLGFIYKWCMLIFVTPTAIGLLLIALGVIQIVNKKDDVPNNGKLLIVIGSLLLVILAILWLVYTIVINKKKKEIKL